MPKTKLPQYRYCVITQVPEWSADDSGDLAVVCLYRHQGVVLVDRQPPGSEMLGLAHMAAFTLGELFIVDLVGREIGGHGRKPSKWPVGYELYRDRASAVARAFNLVEAYPASGQPHPVPRAPVETVPMGHYPRDFEGLDGRMIEQLAALDMDEVLRLPIMRALRAALAAGEERRC